ncbi:MAG: Methicillin resistance protein [Candidatus Woesebacteria bacterium GW2011_GWA1_45_8]|uniref:Methicillin resistance protein n=1 Tax=Candidatus Woesebacteria bacterium GW2011_GWA1_45_8 TaxID=1618559 RepID=A0A0G1MVC8_9BACT|nr:MAG: Methicillin resistance protein [Candidatus Woesebacteria bacterium GW2011_GWA1_45_8]
MVDIRQTHEYANYLSHVGWIIERPAEINYFIKKIPILGSVLKVQRPEELRNEKIRELGKRYRAFQTIIEPKTELDANYLTSIGFKLSKSPYLPTKTLQIDLTQSKQQIFRNLKKDSKQALHKTKNLGTTQTADLEEFRNLWKKAVGVKRYVPPATHLEALRKSFRNKSCFLLSDDKSAGAIFLMGDKITYYWQAFTNKEGRRSLAQYKIVWEGILWAKERGAKVFDFEGIYDERFPNKSWQGFTHFKKSFGGYEVLYPGCMIKTRIPL